MPCGGVSKRLRSRGLPRLHVAGLIMLAMIFSRCTVRSAGNPIVSRGKRHRDSRAHSWGVPSGAFNHLAGSAFRRSVGCGCRRSFPCLWRMALATFTLCGGVSKRLRPCCLASTPGLYKSAATWSVAGLVATAPGSSSWDGLEATPGGVSKFHHLSQCCSYHYRAARN